MGSIGVPKNSTMICTQLISQSVEQVVSDMHHAKAQGADLVEIRLDCIKNLKPQQDLQIILSDKPLPVVVSYRPEREGGLCEGDEYIRLQALKLAIELGADYIEIELEAASSVMAMVECKMNHDCGSKVIVSCYVEGVTPSEEDLSHLVALMEAAGAHILKLVISAADITENARIFRLLLHCQVPLIAYSVGERGLISQLLSSKFGGFLVYGTLEGNTVPGLPTLDSLRQSYKIEYLDADTKVFGLISKPVNHSKGPILHNPALRYVNYNGIYVPMFVDDLKEFFSAYGSPDFAGFSVGIPYKEAVIMFCDEVHHLAKSIGAVNTIIKRSSDGKLVGYNTDCEASISAIEDSLIEHGRNSGEASFSSSLAGKLFVLVGAGGAGRALAFGAKSRRARVVIFDIDFDRAKSLACAISGEARPYEDLVDFQPEAGAILANATPLGMHPNTDRIPISQATLGDYQLVFDSVYTPRKTRLLKEAEAAGTILVSGVEMFLRQAIAQFNLFTGQEAPEEFMREIILAKF
ncbi:bifunctional 3-dehydroquinate dehydratase/shikimate dehydrogenase, chloroplastic-like [Quillaja saponaria]|uniref:Bifunctional 3-dehydroquinate dehydratase/shikimate dehydrogenase, chloroplastic-like n=1 Tax=Quillaja saponaria TaxID=32244 RepID=A0AAD7QAP7_QUISA|nr:bifunctional 3-dehydroquinate dehydratase/shikimate dehydrogenase, chloroplastic-like [Quillaja saponaria]KAJ7978042.1 bifunctional 3-dehydroquinate dehydratase/shikimate dehydrogenase, chloroplastic-like [Quillaja saponaria]